MFYGKNCYPEVFSAEFCGSGCSSGSVGVCSCGGVTVRENNGSTGEAGVMPASSLTGTAAGSADGTDDTLASTMKCHSDSRALPSKPANRASKFPTFNAAAGDRLCTPMMPLLPGWYSKPHSARPVMGSTYSLRRWRRSCGTRGSRSKAESVGGCCGCPGGVAAA